MDSDKKARLIEVFEDTQAYYTENPTLAEAVKKSRDHTVFYPADDYPGLPEIERAGKVTVTKSKTFQAALEQNRKHPGKRIAVLNFASPTNPGGGVKRGSSAQEESLCRCSTLYPTIDRRWLWDKYYGPNREAHDPVGTDACIYSPDVVICKTDENIPERLPPEEFVTVDVITCAAPNLRERPWNPYNPGSGSPVDLTKEQQYDVHLRRAKHILHVAAAHGAEILILGAFGCGAFRNDPEAVAAAYQDALAEYGKYFDEIEFAVYCRGYETGNYDAFRRILGK